MLGVGPCAYDHVLKVIAEISPAAVTNGNLFFIFLHSLTCCRFQFNNSYSPQSESMPEKASAVCLNSQ